MNFQDPSLYGVTPRETTAPFVGAPFFPRFAPFHAHGLQPFQTYGVPYWMQQSWNQPIVPFTPFGQMNPLPYPSYSQPYIPNLYGYGTPFQGPCTMQGQMGLPYFQGWQRPLWY